MKKSFLISFTIFLVCLFIYGCATVIEHKGNCEVNNDMFFGQLSTALEENGFNILNKDPFGGNIKAIKKHIEGGNTTWVISIKNKQITAVCYTGTESLPSYLGPETEKTNLAYWEIINFLEKNCSSKFEIIKK